MKEIILKEGKDMADDNNRKTEEAIEEETVNNKKNGLESVDALVADAMERAKRPIENATIQSSGLMTEFSFNAYLLETYKKTEVSDSEKLDALSGFFEKHPEMKAKYSSFTDGTALDDKQPAADERQAPTEEKIAENEKQAPTEKKITENEEQALTEEKIIPGAVMSPEEELAVYLESQGIKKNDYDNSDAEMKKLISNDIEKERNADFAQYLQNNNVSMEEYAASSKEDKKVFNQLMKEQHDADLKDFMTKNNISEAEFNADPTSKAIVLSEMAKEKRLQSFLASKNMSLDEYKNLDPQAKSELNNGMKSQRNEMASKFAEVQNNDNTNSEKTNIRKAQETQETSQITPDDRETITPVDGAENEISPDDTKGGEAKSGETEKPNVTDAFKKPGMKNFDEEDSKGPFEEGDIIDYMYKKWLIEGANKVWETVSKKLKKWGTAAYIAYLEGLAKGKEKKAELKAQGKPTKTLDRYIESQEKTRKIVDKTNEMFENGVNKLDNTLNLIKQGKFDQINLDSLGEERKNHLLESFAKMQKGQLEEKDLKGVPEERRKELLKEIKESGKTPLAHFCDTTSKTLHDMKDNYEIISKISANYVAASIGHELAKNPGFNEDEKAVKNLELKLMKETMTNIMVRGALIQQEGGNVQEFYQQLGESSEKAKKTTDRRINGNVTMEYGAKPLRNSALDDCKKLLNNDDITSKVDTIQLGMMQALSQYVITDEKQAVSLEAITNQMMGVRAKEEANENRQQQFDKTTGRTVTPNDNQTTQTAKGNNTTINQAIIDNKKNMSK